jgi:hypothetical protein
MPSEVLSPCWSARWRIRLATRRAMSSNATPLKEYAACTAAMLSCSNIRCMAAGCRARKASSGARRIIMHRAAVIALRLSQRMPTGWKSPTSPVTATAPYTPKITHGHRGSPGEP